MFVVLNKINFSTMKKLSLIIAFIIALGNVTFAQKGKKGAAPEIDVPTPVLKTFNTKYKMAKKVVWVQEEDNYRADFKVGDGNVSTAAAYSGDGKLLYTEKEIAKNQYNKSALKYISSEYPGYKITSMRKRDTYDKKTTYLTMLRKSRELLEVEFDKKGGFIRDTDRTPVVVSKKKPKKTEEDEETTDEEKPVKKEAKVKSKVKKEEAEEEVDEDTKAEPKTEEPATKKTKEKKEVVKPEPKKEKAKPVEKKKKKTTEDDEDEE